MIIYVPSISFLIHAASLIDLSSLQEAGMQDPLLMELEGMQVCLPL